MIFSNRKNLHDHIVEYLISNTGTITDITDYLHTHNISPTIQGVYKALRELMTESIVVKQKQTYLLSNVWRKKVSTIFSQNETFKLYPGEQISYRFTKLDHLDMFWKHIVDMTQEETKGFPVFYSEPHSFWFFVPGRSSSEIEYFENFNNTKTYGFSIIGGKTLVDKLKQRFTNDFHQINFTDNYPFNRREHLSIIGPYIITTRVSSTLTRVVDHVYNIAKTEKELSELLRNKFAKPGATIMTVEHNETKAKKLRKRMAKDFYVPRELREQFELF